MCTLHLKGRGASMKSTSKLINKTSLLGYKTLPIWLTKWQMWSHLVPSYLKHTFLSNIQSRRLTLPHLYAQLWNVVELSVTKLLFYWCFCFCEMSLHSIVNFSFLDCSSASGQFHCYSRYCYTRIQKMLIKLELYTWMMHKKGEWRILVDKQVELLQWLSGFGWNPEGENKNKKSFPCK